MENTYVMAGCVVILAFSALIGGLFLGLARLIGAASPLRYRYRLVHLFYALTLTASALATFGVGGTLPAAVILAAWVIVFTSQSRASDVECALVWTLLAFYSCGLPIIGQLRPARYTGVASSARIRTETRGDCESRDQPWVLCTNDS